MGHDEVRALWVRREALRSEKAQLEIVAGDEATWIGVRHVVIEKPSTKWTNVIDGMMDLIPKTKRGLVDAIKQEHTKVTTIHQLREVKEET